MRTLTNLQDFCDSYLPPGAYPHICTSALESFKNKMTTLNKILFGDDMSDKYNSKSIRELDQSVSTVSKVGEFDTWLKNLSKIEIGWINKNILRGPWGASLIQLLADGFDEYLLCGRRLDHNIAHSGVNLIFKKCVGDIPPAMSFVEMRTTLIFAALQPEDVIEIVERVTGRARNLSKRNIVLARHVINIS